MLWYVSILYFIRAFVLVEEPPTAEPEESSKPDDDDEISWLDKLTENHEIDINEPISMAKIYAKRDEAIRKYKFRIGLLSSAILENPEMKVNTCFQYLGTKIICVF